MRTLMCAVVACVFFVTSASGQAGERVLWRFEIPSDVSGRFVGVGPDGRVYTTSFNPPDLYALTPNGTPIWSLSLGSASGHWPITFADDGTIYTGAVGVRAVNPDGTLRWAFDPGAWVLAGPSVGPDGNIYAADDVNTGGLGFFSLDPDGNLRWSTPGDPLVSGLVEQLDEIVFGTERLFGGVRFRRSGGWVSTYAFDFQGHQLWYRFYGPDGGPSSNPQPMPDGRLAFRWGQGSLAALQGDGTDDWVAPHPDGAQVLVPPATGPDGAIYAGDEFGVQLWSADAQGTMRWVLGANLDEHLRSLGVSPDNRVLVAGGWTWSESAGVNLGWIRGYDPSDGGLLWQVDLELEQNLSQIPRTIRPAFSSNGDTAYLTTQFVGDGVGHTYLYAIALREPTAVRPGVDLDGPGASLVSLSPNPCFESATILFTPARDGIASVTIHDAAGRKVRSLYDGFAGGQLRLNWDLRDGRAQPVATGVYFLRAHTSTGTSTTKILVAR